MSFKILYPKELNYSDLAISKLANCGEIVNVDPCELDSILEIGGNYDVIFLPLRIRFNDEHVSKFRRLSYIVTNTTSEPHILFDRVMHSRINVISLKSEVDFLDEITPTSELAVALHVFITRPIISSISFVKSGNWGRWDFGGQKMLSKMTCGVIGLGRIGSKVASTLKTIGSNIIYYDPYIQENTNFKKANKLSELIRNVDILSIHCHLTSETTKLVNHELIKQASRPIYIVNTARAEIVDQDAICQALATGHVLGYAADVLEGELDDWKKIASSKKLVDMSNEGYNVIITPHIGGSTYDAWTLTQEFVVDRLAAEINR